MCVACKGVADSAYVIPKVSYDLKSEKYVHCFNQCGLMRDHDVNSRLKVE